jgi:hypothetical protein
MFSAAGVTFIYIIHIQIISLNCRDEDCTDTIDIPLTDKINAPLKVELDIRQLIKELKVVIKSEVKRGVTIAMEDHVDSIIADKVKDLKKHLITNNADNGALLNHYIKGSTIVCIVGNKMFLEVLYFISNNAIHMVLHCYRNASLYF